MSEPETVILLRQDIITHHGVTIFIPREREIEEEEEEDETYLT